jgi:hypothetical protein
MDKTALVAGDLEIEGAVVEALSKAKIPVTAIDWTWVPQFEASKLVVVTSLYDAKGPRESYARILEALSEAGVYQSVPIRELFVIGPEDPLARELTRELKLVTEGVIHVSRTAVANAGDRYSIIFTPYRGTGGAIPSVTLKDRDELRSFLEKRLGIRRYVVDQAFEQLAKKGSVLLPDVQLNLRRAKKLNLAA